MKDSLVLPHGFLEHLSAVDGVCLAVLVLSAAGGLLRGFSREAASLFVWVGAGWLCLRSGAFLVGIYPVLNTTPGANVAVHVGLFVVGMIVLNSLTRRIVPLGRDVLSGGVDMLLGVGFGLLRGYVFLVAIGIFLSWAAVDWLAVLMHHSILAPYVVQGMALAQGYLPADLASHSAVQP